MELTVLGADGTFPRAHSACSGYLIEHDGFKLWMDAGNGTLAFLQQHASMDDVDAIFISHSHVDHCADLYPFFYQLINTRRTVPLWTAPGVRDTLQSLIGEGSREDFDTLLKWHVLDTGDVADIGPFRFEAFDAAHSTINATVRVQAGGRTLCYSGDTGPNPDLAVAARGADLFVCEASWLEKDDGVMEPIHMKAAESGAAARDAGVKRLVLTHVWPVNPLEQVREEASKTFDGTIEFARETTTTTI
ncbi:MAG: MBL fold metallo-hydrolase [Actinomycetota bacterium]